MIPAWNGSTVTALCDRCKTPEEIPDYETFTDETGYCTACERLVTWTVWDGPVIPV